MPLLILIFATTGFVSAAQRCDEAVERAIKQKPKTPCSAGEPDCNLLTGSADKIAELRKRRAAAGANGDGSEFSEICVRKVHAQCQTYSQLLAAGRDESTALRCAMGDCVQSFDSIRFKDVQCVCFLKPSVAEECRLEVAMPPILSPPGRISPAEQR